MMDLLEREAALQTLETYLDNVVHGQGQLVLLFGEAGIGKTSLISHFVQHQERPVRFLRGTCDPFSTPHPLCPILDIARQIPDDELGKMLWEPTRAIIFHAIFERIQFPGKVSLVVFEDIHWADEATLDLITFLGRRIQDSSCLMIVTYRDTELSLDHPVRTTIGHLAGDHIHRLKLEPLSKETVDQLAHQSGPAIDNLYELTGGNPYYVSEILNNPTEGIPHSLSDSIMARFTAQPIEIRRILELASIIPKERFESWLLDVIWGLKLDVLEECSATGLVLLEENAIVFRHDLARQIIYRSLPDVRRKMLHILAIHGLRESYERGIKVGFTHIVYHAHQAKDKKTLLKYAPLAAQEAINLGAHIQAAMHYRSLLPYLDEIGPIEQAELYEALAYECYLTGEIEEATQHCSSALYIWQVQKNIDGIGRALRWLSRYNWFQGNRELAEKNAEEAIATLEALPPTAELAFAYSNRAQLHMLKSEYDDAIDYGNRSIELARQFDEVEIVAHALNNVGTAQCLAGDETGFVKLRESLALGLEHEFGEHAARAYTNIGSLAVSKRLYDRASQHLIEGIDYCEKYNLNSWTLYMRGWLARLYFEQGQWTKAEDEAYQVLHARHKAVAIRQPAVLALAYVAVRRGSEVAQELLDEARLLATQMDEVDRLCHTIGAVCEYAWLNGDLESIRLDLREQYEIALGYEDPWSIGLLAFWLWKSGNLHQIPDSAATPYLLQLSGDWQGAAGSWEKLGCPYEQALALTDGDEDAQKTALGIFDDLGAESASRWLRTRMRSEGIRGLPRGPRPDTQSNPADLTPRQMEVLKLLVNGFSDAEIAETLFISPKTVGHHVSAILSKLEVRSRQEAALLAIQNDWLHPERPEDIP
jgi:DNA-binding CsgD family transcriptional regulator/tetratricopeptide (TPR) repeat protein